MQPEQMLQQALAAHRAGRLTEAEQGYRGLLRIRPDFAEIHVSLAQVLMLQGRLDEAEASATVAVRHLPNQPIAHSRLADILALQGKLSQAETAYRRTVSLKPDFAEAHNNLGNVLQQQGRLEEAAASYHKAVAARPQFVEALTNLAAIAVRRADIASAMASLEKVFALRKDYAPAYNALGSAQLAAGRVDEAVTAFRTAISLQPGNGEAFNNLGGALETLGQHDEALAAYRRAEALLPPDSSLLLNIGNVLKAMGRLADAETQYRRAVSLAPDAPQPCQHLAMAVCEQGRLDEGFALFREAAALAWAPSGEGPAYRRKHDGEQAGWASSNGVGEGFHLDAAPRQPEAAVHVGDRSGIEASWKTARPQVVVLDDFLSPQALASLRHFCMASSVWRENHSEGYLGAMPETGFAPPLLAQIAEELRAGYPAIFGNLPLLHHWAFKYDSSLGGIKVHADFAAVNVNFWITPDEANRDPDHGGLVIWDVAAPLDWDFRSYNSDDDRIRAYLKAQGAKAVTVPYRANRAVIFDSDLFHETDVIDFREGYENRRINVTLLYGVRTVGQG